MAMVMAVTVETSYISETLYPSSHLIPKTFHMVDYYIPPFYQ